MGLSAPGIGSNLDVNGIVSKLMTVEQQPLTLLAQKEAKFTAKISAYGNLNSALTTFQNSLASLSTADKFQGLNANVSDSSILTATTSSKAVAGTYNINVSQLAQAQTIIGTGQASTTAAIGSGASTAITFQFGTISGGNFVSSGSNLSANAASGGIGANSLSLNGTTIVTNGTTNSAKALATQINLLTATTGVTATAQPTDTGVQSFNAVSTGAGDSYSLVVGTTTLASIGASSSFSAANLDTALASGPVAAGLASDGISFTGTAVAGNLHFTKADGTNIAITQTLNNVSGNATGGIAALTSGVTQTYTSSVSLSSSNPITIGGTNPSIAGFNAGLAPVKFSGATFAQDSSFGTGTVTIDSTNNSLQGIRDAINKANVGVTASIVSDGSSNPNHLVITSNKSGASASMKVTVAAGNSALTDLLAYDPAGTQNFSQTTAAQSTALTVNGIPVTSKNLIVPDAIQGTTLNVSKLGSTSVTISRDTNTIQNNVNSFVQAYNGLNSTLATLTSYDSTTKQAGLLLGDAATRQIQSQVKSMISSSLSGLGGSLTNLTQIGITFAKDGSMSLDSSKLQAAMANNVNDVAGLFSSMGTTSDSLISYVGSTSATKPGRADIVLGAIATQGKQVGSSSAGLTITGDVNDSLDITIDGVSASVKLLAGTYTASTLAAQIQSSINSASALMAAGVAVSVSADNSGVMTITSNRYGSASNVTIGGLGAGNLLGSSPVSTAGIDVAGTINGLPATGSGQFLTGATGFSTEGLKLQISGGTTGARGTVNFSQGYAFQLNQMIGNYVGASGIVTANTDGLNRSIADLNRQKDQVKASLTVKEAQYRAQFTALDTLISSMNSTQNYLTQQLAQISANSRSSN